MISLMFGIIASLFSVFTYYNQVKTSIECGAEPAILNNNNLYFGFGDKNLHIWVSNIGYKTTTIIEIELTIGKKSIPLRKFQDEEIFNSTMLCPGEYRKFFYNKDKVIEIVSKGNYDPQTLLCWTFKTYDGKKYCCKTNNRVKDVVNCKNYG